MNFYQEKRGEMTYKTLKYNFLFQQFNVLEKTRGPWNASLNEKSFF